MDPTNLAVAWLQDQLRSQLHENSANTVKYAQCLERQTLIPRQMQEMKDEIAELQDQITLLVKRVSELENGRGHASANSRPVNGTAQNGTLRTENAKIMDTANPPPEHIPLPTKEPHSLKRASTTPDSTTSEHTPASKKRSSTSSSSSSPWSSLKSLTKSDSPIQNTPLLFHKPPPNLLADGTRNKHGHRSWIQILKSQDPAFTVNATYRSRLDMFYKAYNLPKVELKFHNTPAIPERLYFEFCEFMKVGWKEYVKREKDIRDCNSDAILADGEKPSDAVSIVSAGDGNANVDIATAPAKEARTAMPADLPETIYSDIEECIIIDSEYAPAQKSSTASNISPSNNHAPSTPGHQSTSFPSSNKSTGATIPAQRDATNVKYSIESSCIAKSHFVSYPYKSIRTDFQPLLRKITFLRLSLGINLHQKTRLPHQMAIL
ncbi:hypothetical protein HDU81_007475 [Chytriomyces hyalinus]|nr:hypothetical protein HDU81_007475 [Chytriomyces hyalinus]